jgi:hypothetical protein
MSDERSSMGPHSFGASFSMRAVRSDALPCAPLSDGSGGDGRAMFCEDCSAHEVFAPNLKIGATPFP